MATSQSITKAHPPSYIPSTTTTSSSNELPVLCDIKLICTRRKKNRKRHIYLTFIESRSLSTPDEQPCIEFMGRATRSSILLHDCISFEDFNQIKSDFQSFIYIYFQSYTVSIYFSDENLLKKTAIIRHLECIYRNHIEGTQPQSAMQTTEHILHTFDTKLIPYQSVITSEHGLIGPIRLYFTSTDLYIASVDASRIDLNTTIINQCPSKHQLILCIPYFTIKHYGNRSTIFLIELGKSSYGDGEIRMKCHSSSLARTIHLLASPIIEERPLALSSAFSNQFLTHNRIEKAKKIHPPIQLNHDVSNGPIIDLALPFLKNSPAEFLPTNSTKSCSFVGSFRKFVKHISPLQRSSIFDTSQKRINRSSHDQFQSKQQFLEDPIEGKKLPTNQQGYISTQSHVECLPLRIPTDNSMAIIVPSSSNRQETTMGSYIEMGSIVKEADSNFQAKILGEETSKEAEATMDMGVNTTISLSPHVRSAIIIGNSVHLIAEEKTAFSIGQRSFTSPACVLQPFKAQLSRQPTIHANTTSSCMNTCAPSSSSSFHQPISTSNSRQSLLLSYGIVTVNHKNDQTEHNSILLSDGSAIDHRLSSDCSLMSLPYQRQPSNIYSFDNILSPSSSGSHIFRTLSASTNNTGDNRSCSILPSHGSIIVFDDRYSDQPTNYLLGSLPVALVDDSHSINRSTSISRSHVSQIYDDKRPSNDAYAIVEPRSKIIQQSLAMNYTNILLPSSSNVESSTSGERRSRMIPLNDQSVMVVYTDIDHHQTQGCHRLAQLTTISDIRDRTPPFVL